MCRSTLDDGRREDSDAQSAAHNLFRRRCSARCRRCASERRTHQNVAEPERLGDADGQLRQPALLSAQADHGRQRRQAAGGVDVLDRRAARPRRRAAGHRRRDVRAWAVPEPGLRARSEERRQDPLEIRAQAGSERHPRDVLRHGQSRPRLCRRQDLPASGRHHAGRSRCQDRQGRLVSEERRSGERRDRHVGAHGGQGQGPRRHFGRRVRRAVSRDRLRPQDRQAGLARLFGGPGRPDSWSIPAKTTELGKPVGKDSSLKTWQGDQWKIGGGCTWGWYSYDPAART